MQNAWTYNAAGRIVTRVTPGVTSTSYTYDAIGQLLTATGESTLTYDANGNRGGNAHRFTVPGNRLLFRQ